MIESSDSIATGPTPSRHSLSCPRAADATPAVSIVLPVHDSERYLAEAIESLRRQTLEAIEIIVVDDGSRDRSRAIALAIAHRDPRILVVPRDHHGLVAALNAGVAAARSPLVARMDADDVSAPTRLAKQVAFLEDHASYVAVGSHVEVMDSGGDRLGVYRYPTRHADIVRALIHGRSSLAHPTVVMRKHALEDVGGYRHGRFPSEDLDLWLRLSTRGGLANLPEPLLYYRKHAAAVSARERDSQVTRAAVIVDEARIARGLAPLGRRPTPRHRSAAALCHVECACAALSSANRRAALRHALAGLRHDPRWWRAYAALTACALPASILQACLAARDALREALTRSCESATQVLATPLPGDQE